MPSLHLHKPSQTYMNFTPRVRNTYFFTPIDFSSSSARTRTHTRCDQTSVIARLQHGGQIIWFGESVPLMTFYMLWCYFYLFFLPTSEMAALWLAASRPLPSMALQKTALNSDSNAHNKPLWRSEHDMRRHRDGSCHDAEPQTSTKIMK